jgi:hypothetical protein
VGGVAAGPAPAVLAIWLVVPAADEGAGRFVRGLRRALLVDVNPVVPAPNPGGLP